jgi:hypothetical protein
MIINNFILTHINYSFITLPEKDSLFEYQSPQGPFSDLVKCSPLAYINRLFVLYVY